MPEESYLTPAVKAYIGRKGPVRHVEVSRRDILRFAVSTGDTNPLYRDDAYAKQTPYGGIIAPPFFTCALAIEEEDIEDLEASGLGKKMGLRMEVPVQGMPGAIAVGREYSYREPIRPGDVIGIQERIANIFEKQGRLGPMIFIVSEFTYTNQRGEVVQTETSTMIRHK